MKIYKKAFLPPGFLANGLSCGIKRSGKMDLALFYSCFPAKASCMFTSNTLPAAPILVNKLHLGSGKEFRAIIANSGNANCFTGKKGIQDAKATAKDLSRALQIKPGEVLVASTGIIGRQLKLKNIIAAVPKLVEGLSGQGINKAKLAILTTDNLAKEVTVRFKINQKTVTMCGIAKGAGMIAPDLATMLAFVFTDANITQKALDKALNLAVNASFNCVTVDGCMSTNDSVMLLANQAAGNTLIDTASHFNLFAAALKTLCLELAKMLVRDAEGATKFIRIEVDKAKTTIEARRIALNIANSNLFKTAVFGANPNFGRIVAAVGASGVAVKEKDLKVHLSPLSGKDVSVNVSVGRGRCSAVVYTSDLTPEYVKINAEYS